MKIVVVHGDDQKASRERFLQITKGVKRKGWGVVNLSNESNFERELTSNSLFGDENLYIVDEIAKLSTKQLEWLTKNGNKFSSQLLIYSKKLIGKLVLKKFPKAKIEEFTLPKNLFTFVDSLYPGNSENALRLFENLMQEKQPLELLVSLMAKQFRDLIWVLHGGSGLVYPDWRMRKLKLVANKFTTDELEDIIGQLAEIDYKSKTSDVDPQLLLEMLITEKL